MKRKTDPIKRKKEIKENPDNKIDQDFKGYPYGLAKDETINPRTKKETQMADLDNKDDEKIVYQKNEVDEQDSDGSANAFENK